MTKQKALEIYNYLSRLIDNPQTELNYSNNFELLIAVMLSARCTDKRVNIVTKELFKKYNTPESLASINQDELERIIFSVGFYKEKASNIIQTCKRLVEKYNSVVPNNYDDLITLPGVGRKTANVVLIVGFKKPAIPVDTHVFRVSNRLGLTKAKNVLECEQQLAKLFDENYYETLHHLLILFGRYYCKASNKECNVDYLIRLVNEKESKLKK